MTQKRSPKLNLATGFVAALVLIGPAMILAQDQAPDPHAAHSGTDQPAMMDEGVEAMRQKMQAKMHAWDEELDALVAEMHSASSDHKTEAIAAVVSELVDQRKAMHGMMMRMQPAMAGHMMEHMSSGMAAGMEQAMARCPMMKGLNASEEPAMPEDAAAHHSDED